VTHIHSLWSDGDAAPELITAWYKDHGYNFICFSEHHTLQEGERWVAVGTGKKDKLTPERLESLKAQFGAETVEVRTNPEGVTEMRLKTHDELKTRFETPGEFLLIPAQEVTSVGQSPHFNAVNTREPIKGERGEISGIIKKYIAAVDAQEVKYGVPMFGHLNHLNWSDGVTTEEVLEAQNLQFLEVYNGHSYVHTWGNPEKGRPSSERHWDVLLSMRPLASPAERLFGLATDDSHEYFEWNHKATNPGRGWVMVQAKSLTPDDIVHAMEAGDFYSSTGVDLKSVAVKRGALRVAIDAEPGVSYITQFVGTRRGFDRSSEPVLGADGKPIPRSSRKYSDEIGQVLLETTANPAVYKFTGDELYVRARVLSSKLQENGSAEGDKEIAWTQPVLPPAKRGK